MIYRFQLLPQRQMAAGGAMARQMFSVLGIKFLIGPFETKIGLVFEMLDEM
jgi:hypothetical protein